MSKHSEGPWARSIQNGVIQDAEGESIGQAWATLRGGNRQKQNWALMTAAPQLLEALQAIIALQPEEDPDTRWSGDTPPWAHNTAEDAWALGVSRGNWEAAKIAVEALKAAGVEVS